MLLERLFENLALSVKPIAVCQVAHRWRLRMGARDSATFHFVLQGKGVLRSGKNLHQTLGPNSLAIVPPRLPHAIQNGEPVRAETSIDELRTNNCEQIRFLAGPRGDAELLVACGQVQVTYARSLELFDSMHEPIVLDFSDSTEMQLLFERLLEEERSSSPAREAMMVALLNQCLVMVFRRLCTDPECPLPWLSALEDPRLAAVLEAILQEPARPHTIDSLAAKAFMSRSAFVKNFTAHFGRTPKAFLRDVRLRQAADILRTTDLSVDAVASSVGFHSRSHFSHAFAQYYGQSPAQLRQGIGTPATR